MTDIPTALNAALADRYAIERELGAGGMATVYLAEDVKHRRQVAVKVLRPELAAALGHERFLGEITTTANLRHPHILPLYDSGEADGFLFYVMPYVEGESLRERLDREKQLPLDDALQIAREVADALSYAHSRGVIHRDIKPDNILLESGHAVVADFGIARAVSAAGGQKLTQTGMAIGTPQYMSPEQAAGESDVDGRSDLYSLACVLYEMLAGQPPFTGPTVESVVHQLLTAEPRAITQIRPAVPAEVAAALRRALAKTPADRFNPVAQFSEALRPGALARPSAAPAGRPAERSIAVLPFGNMSADPADEFFADGISEEIINALAQIEGLQVAARTSCFAFKGKTEDLRLVGQRLGVATVLEGSVRKAGSRLRVTAQLINATDGYHLWSERYDRELVDVFALQDEIAGAIAAKLQLALGQQPSRGAGPRNIEAYELLLKGRVLHTRRGRWLKDALACFERAVALDPDLAEAHALQGDCYRLLALYHIAPATEMMPRARAAAERALARDADQVEALATLASVVAMHDWDVAESDRISGQALALDPTHVRALCERAAVYSLREDAPAEWEQALHDLRKARGIDPLNAWAAAIHAMSLGFMGRFEDGLEEARHAVSLDAENFTARWTLVNALVDLGRHEEALKEAEPGLMMSGRHPMILGPVAVAHAARGDREAAADVYQEIASRARSAYIGWTEQGAAAAAAGRLEEARELVARGVQAREPFAAFWKMPAWAPFRADPEGYRILRSTGFGVLRAPA